MPFSYFTVRDTYMYLKYMHISLGAWPVWAEDEEDDDALTIDAPIVCVCARRC